MFENGFWFPAIGPAVFGWGLFTFYIGLLETWDARKFKVNRKKRTKSAARDGRQTQAAAEHMWDLWAGLRIYCLKSGLHVSFKWVQERLLFKKYKSVTFLIGGNIFLWAILNLLNMQRWAQVWGLKPGLTRSKVQAWRSCCGGASGTSQGCYRWFPPEEDGAGLHRSRGNSTATSLWPGFSPGLTQTFQVGYFQNTVTRCRISPHPARQDCFFFLFF